MSAYFIAMICLLAASDFADDHPHVEVIGTDISPIQPGWIPPNLKL